MKDFSKLERKLEINFKDKNLLTQAFCHRSFLNENHRPEMEHNERLEFLGDAVLEMAVTELLYRKYPKRPEGELTSWRAALVNADSLAKTAKALDFNDYLLLSKGEARDTGKARAFILANAFEAFIGALYLDQGYRACLVFIRKQLWIKLPEIIKRGLHKDAKSRFQEITQDKTGITPSYKVLQESGPDHAKHFEIGVFLGEDLVAKGEGSSKQEAEEDAAQNALEVKQW